MIAGPIATASYVEGEKAADTFKQDREALQGRSMEICSNIKGLHSDLEESAEEQQDLVEELCEESARQEKNMLELQFIADLQVTVREILELVMEAKNEADVMADEVETAGDMHKVRESAWERIHQEINNFHAKLEETVRTLNQIESCLGAW